MNLQKLLKFVKITAEFRDVERRVVLMKAKRNENDAEHSYQLAMTAWYIINSEKLDLNSDLVIKYALIHDLVEVYAGDTPIEGDIEWRKSKVAREKAAEVRLNKELPEFPDLTHLLHTYEERKDEESKFVYALDKIMPMLQVYLEGGYSWRVNKLTLQNIIDHKADKITLSPIVQKYYDELIGILRREEKDIFEGPIDK